MNTFFIGSLQTWHLKSVSLLIRLPSDVLIKLLFSKSLTCNLLFTGPIPANPLNLLLIIIFLWYSVTLVFMCNVIYHPCSLLLHTTNFIVYFCTNMFNLISRGSLHISLPVSSLPLLLSKFPPHYLFLLITPTSSLKIFLFTFYLTTLRDCTYLYIHFKWNV